jgi:hypothetical protein
VAAGPQTLSRAVEAFPQAGQGLLLFVQQPAMPGIDAQSRQTVRPIAHTHHNRRFLILGCQQETLQLL